MNERVTEDIVRRHFAAYACDVLVEEQSSNNPIVKKLLRSASKSGLGQGFPEFIVSFNTDPALLIVVECKADPLKHESATRDQYADYAVDGVLLYSGHLSRGFDVISIAVSGTETDSINISHFLQLQGQGSSQQVFGDELLSPQDYHRGYLDNPDKFQVDYQSLQAFIRRLNIELNSDKVSESKRSLLISAILIALEREPFRQSYAFESNPAKLADSVISNALTELERANIGVDSLRVLKQNFGFLSTDAILTTDLNELRRIVKEIDTEVNSFIKNHTYTDVLGNLYVEFLKYGNNDKGLGIVLTPPHITELFVDLAAVQRDSIVYDNCAGTGGFLISAMKRMMQDAKGASKVEERIKDQQLYGVEQRDDIYSLAVSNMFIHQDGKSNVKLGNCFDKNIMDWVKAQRPTVGMLNPPYRVDKQNDPYEFEFVLNNIDCLSAGSTCVAIIPMQCALASHGINAMYKSKLMRHHTVEAVLSMPDELFFNSDVSVVSCVIVLTAHRAHPRDKRVFLGYFKDDGFVKQRIGGRVDANNAWQNKKKEWLTLFEGRQNASGMSVNLRLEATDEWAAEAHMETDYSQLTDALFELTLFKYSTYLFSNRLRRDVSSDPVNSQGGAMKLDAGSWAWFSLVDLFDVRGTRTTTLKELQLGGDGPAPYVTTQTANNGVRGRYSQHTETGGVLTVDSAVAGFCAYQQEDFSASDHVEKLVPRFTMSSSTGMFLVTILNLEQYRYNYGLKRSQSRLKNSQIKLPVDTCGNPDFAFMEAYIQRLPCSSNLL